MTTPVLVFDLDGTLYPADHAARAYATALASSLPAHTRDQYLDAFEAFLARRVPPPEGTYDPWEVAVALAHGPKAAPGDFPHAFTAARQALRNLPTGMIAAPGLQDFLTWAQPRATIVVATNASLDAAEEALHRMHLRTLIAHLFTEVGKPDHLPTLLCSIARSADTTMSELLMCGDNYRIDVEPVLGLGCTTVELNPFDFTAPSLSTLRVRTIEEALGFIRAWVEDHTQVADPRSHRAST